LLSSHIKGYCKYYIGGQPVHFISWKLLQPCGGAFLGGYAKSRSRRLFVLMPQ